MKRPDGLTDEELAEAVAVEVLGAVGYVIDPVFGLAWELPGGRVLDILRVLSPEGRAAIEDEIERRGWGLSFLIISVRIDGTLTTPDYEIEIWPKASISGKEGVRVLHKNKYRALCEAVLLAVRGEKKSDKSKEKIPQIPQIQP